MLQPGLTHTTEAVVSQSDTASALGSGDMPVLATPAMIALMENAAMLAVADYLPDGSTTVGIEIATTHNSPSQVGAAVSATAILTNVDGRRLTFEIKAIQGDTVIGTATHVRFIVDRTRFLSKL